MHLCGLSHASTSSSPSFTSEQSALWAFEWVITQAFATGKAVAKPYALAAETSLGGNRRRTVAGRARSAGAGSPGVQVVAGCLLNLLLSRTFV
jgi:hypothetical protein